MPRYATARIAHGVVLLGLLATLNGCLGPAAVRATRLKYNEAYRRTNDEQLLLNIVCLRYADSPVFVDLTNITSQFELAARGTYTNGLDGQGPGPTNLPFGELLVRDSPTLSYHPREGREVAAALITPLTAEILRAVSPGANTEQFLVMSISDINDVPNAPRATSLTPRLPEDNSLFRHGLEILISMQERDMVELALAKYDTDRFDPIPMENVSSRDVLSAVQAGYVFRTHGNAAELRKRESAMILKVRPEAVNSPEMEEFTRIFGLTPGLLAYKVKSELDDVENEQELPEALKTNDTLLLNMRSPLQMMSFLSKGVDVPRAHEEKGIVPTTPGPNGCPYDWTVLTRGLFQVHVSKHKPLHAEVTVPYRGYWFYIDEGDVKSRASLALIEMLFALQEVEGQHAGPLLTLPIQ